MGLAWYHSKGDTNKSHAWSFLIFSKIKNFKLGKNPLNIMDESSSKLPVVYGKTRTKTPSFLMIVTDSLDLTQVDAKDVFRRIQYFK